jgi:Helix-hairpin-helix motif
LPPDSFGLILCIPIGAIRIGRIEETMRTIFLGTISLLVLAGCNRTNPSPETIRHDTAKATNEAVTDAKAVAKGVVDGLKQQRGPRGAIDINGASADDLETLPGIDAVRARKIVDGRPYDDPSDLRKRHILTSAEYDRISGQLAAH